MSPNTCPSCPRSAHHEVGEVPNGARRRGPPQLESPPKSPFRPQPWGLSPPPPALLGEDVCERSHTDGPPNGPLPRSGGGAERSEAEGASSTRVSAKEPPPTSALRPEPTSPSSAGRGRMCEFPNERAAQSSSPTKWRRCRAERGGGGLLNSSLRQRAPSDLSPAA